MKLRVDWSKIDAALAGALQQEEDRDARRLAVFVQLNADAPDHQALSELGVPGAGGQSGVCTATLSHQEVARLSEQPWVRRLALSGRQRLTGPQASDRPEAG